MAALQISSGGDMHPSASSMSAGPQMSRTRSSRLSIHSQDEFRPAKDWDDRLYDKPFPRGFSQARVPSDPINPSQAAIDVYGLGLGAPDGLTHGDPPAVPDGSALARAFGDHTACGDPEWDKHTHHRPFPRGFNPSVPDWREEARQSVRREMEAKARCAALAKGEVPLERRHLSREAREAAKLQESVLLQLDGLRPEQLDALHHMLPPSLQLQLHQALKKRMERTQRQKAAAERAEKEKAGKVRKAEQTEAAAEANPTCRKGHEKRTTRLRRPCSLPELGSSRGAAVLGSPRSSASEAVLTPEVAAEGANDLSRVYEDFHPSRSGGSVGVEDGQRMGSEPRAATRRERRGGSSVGGAAWREA